MTDENCEITVSSCLTVAFPDTTWRNDTLVPTPILDYPVDERTFCLDVISGDTQICLTWFPIAEATVYLVQWALNPEFNGPSVQEVIIDAPFTEYCLFTPEDIRQGESVYWRIQAANKITGGVSNKSAVRKVTYNCNTSQDKQTANKCDRYNVNVIVHGEDTMGCCDARTFWAEVTFDCKAPDGSNLITVADGTWSLKQQGTSAKITPNGNNKYVAKLETCSSETQVIQVCYEVTFNDVKTATTFTCSGCEDVLLDCEINSPDDLDDTEVQEPIGNSTTCGEPLNVICTECDCGTSCTLEQVSQTVTDLVVNAETYTTLIADELTCRIQYQLELEFLYNANAFLLYVFKGPGKSVGTVPKAETDDHWIFEIIAPSSPLILKYDGCSNEVDSVFTIYVEPNQEEATFGAYLECANASLSRDIITLSGPVVKVGDACEEWPSCGNQIECCDYGRYTLDGRPLLLNLPIIYHELCTCCEEGISTLEVTLTGVTVDCQTELISASLSVVEICGDITSEYTTTTPDHLCGLSNTTALSFFGGECTLDLTNVPGSYNIPDNLDPNDPDYVETCPCIPQRLTVQLEYDSESGNIAPVTRENSTYIIPTVDANELVLSDRLFQLQDISFDGCEMNLYMCDSQIECTSCGDLTCDCFGGPCGFAPKEIALQVTYNDFLGNQIFNVTATLNCITTDYTTPRFIATTINGCSITARVVIRSGVVIIEAEADQTYSWPVDIPVCPDNIINGSIGKSINCPTDVSPNNTDNFTFTVVGTPLVCDCASSFIPMFVNTCEPFNATGSVVVEGKLLEVTITSDEDDSCGCYGTKVNLRDEARIDIGIGCGLVTGVDLTGSPNIRVDAEGLVGQDEEHGYFELLDSSFGGSESEDTEAGCPFISPPVCECVIGFPVYKNSSHLARTVEFIGQGNIGVVSLVEEPFDGNITFAKNVGPGDCEGGEDIIMHVSNDCLNMFLCPCCDGGPSDPSDPSECNECLSSISLTINEVTNTASTVSCGLPVNCTCYDFSADTWPLSCGDCDLGPEEWEVTVHCCDSGAVTVCISRTGCSFPEDSVDRSGCDTVYLNSCIEGGTVSGVVDLYASPASPGDPPVCSIPYTLDV